MASTAVTRAECERLDAADPLRAYRDRFVVPDGLVYLDGNSLGLLPRGVVDRVSRTVTDEWGTTLIRSWNEHGWVDLPQRIGDKLARLVGAPAGSIVAGDTTSVNLFKALAAALTLRPDRRVLLSDTGNFPTDLYVAQGLARLLARGHEVRLVQPEDVMGSLDEDVAVLFLTDVDYRTSRVHDMHALTRRAHEVGALTVWDLGHSAGALPVDLTGANADLAVGCTYKYLCGGPGAPAFLYVRPDLQDQVEPPLAGWWGHASPFAFSLEFEPAPGITRQQCGTPPVLSLAALDAALEVWADVDLHAVRRKSQELFTVFAALVEQRCNAHGLELAGPRDPAQRGSAVAWHCPEGYAVMQALIAEGVVGDFRAPDLIRFGLTPLTTRYVDVFDAAATLGRVLDERLWDTPSFRAQKAVT